MSETSERFQEMLKRGLSLRQRVEGVKPVKPDQEQLAAERREITKAQEEANKAVGAEVERRAGSKGSSA